MNAWYKVKFYDGFDAHDDLGIAFGEDEPDIVKNLKHYYGEIEELTIRFDENYDASVVPFDDMENPWARTSQSNI